MSVCAQATLARGYYLMRRNILLLVVLLEAACVFLLCWFPSHKKAESNFKNASITITNSLSLTLKQDAAVNSQTDETKALSLKTGDKVRIRRITDTNIEFYGDDTKEYPGVLPVEAFEETDKINELLAPSRNAEEIRKEEYLQDSLIKNIVVTIDFFAIMGGLCLLASIKYDWMGFAANVLLVIVAVIIVFALKDTISSLMF